MDIWILYGYHQALLETSCLWRYHHATLTWISFTLKITLFNLSFVPWRVPYYSQSMARTPVQCLVDHNHLGFVQAASKHNSHLMESVTNNFCSVSSYKVTYDKNCHPPCQMTGECKEKGYAGTLYIEPQVTWSYPTFECFFPLFTNWSVGFFPHVGPHFSLSLTILCKIFL